jgi:hypothetical protein
MDETPQFPLTDDVEWLVRHAKLPLHVGTGTVEQHGDPDHPIARVFREFRERMGRPQSDSAESQFDASFFVPPAGN